MDSELKNSYILLPNGNWNCCKCNNEYSKNTNKKRHVNLCKGKAPTEAFWTCAFCKLNFGTNFVREEHYMNCAELNKNHNSKWRCEFCNKEFAISTRKYTHYAKCTHKKSEDQDIPTTGTECDKSNFNNDLDKFYESIGIYSYPYNLTSMM